MAAQGYPDARRGDYGLHAGVNATLREQFDLDSDPLRSSAGGLHRRRTRTASAWPNPLRGQVVAAAVALLNAEPLVALAVARDDLLADPMPPELNPEELTLRERLRLTAVGGRSPDMLRAYWTLV